MNRFKLNYLRFLTSEKMPDGTSVALPDETLKSIDKIEVTPKGTIKFVCKMKIDTSKWRFVCGSGI